MDGFDLSRLHAGRSPGKREVAYGGFANSFYLRDRSWCYLGRNDGANRRLFDLRADPAATRNVVAEHPDVVARLDRRLLGLAGGPLPFYGDYLDRKRAIRERAAKRKGARRGRAAQAPPRAAQPSSTAGSGPRKVP